MLLSLKVDGFRSLVRFSLQLRPGLNLLVGPNGSGKTNIISFLRFLAELGRNDLSSIVSELGGSGAVFRKIGASKYQSKIRAKVTGSVAPDERYVRKDREEHKDSRLFYSYSFEIELSDDRESVFFGRQEFAASILPSNTLNLEQIDNWQTLVEVRGQADGSVTCKRLVLTDDKKKDLVRHQGGKSQELTPEKVIENQTSANVSIVSLAFAILPPGWAIPLMTDFSRGEVFNPHPSRIRLAEDSAKSPGIRPDGSGLYASLFALKRGGGRTQGALFYPFFFVGRPGEDAPFDPKVKLDRLIEFFKLAYPPMVTLSVTNDQFENTIRARITLEGVGKPQIPLAALSDGTLKWMAFVTAIFTNSNIIGIEEPENFVHPLVQREAIRLVRERLQDNFYMFMSSHSETILNSAEPEEIVVVSSRGSRTNARRIKNPSQLRKQINASGFGVGFYYLSGALEDA